MQVTGVQAVGARGLGGLQVTVAEPTPLPAAGRAGAEAARAPAMAPELLLNEAVVFPRDGTPLDHRPLQLRQERAARRYREDGDPEHDDEESEHGDPYRDAYDRLVLLVDA